MKQGLSLRASQHLALTPQLQQSIRLLQLSTLELTAEVEQMLDDNPFLERENEEAPREEFGVSQTDAPPRDDEPWTTTTATETSDDSAESTSLEDQGNNWEGDGSVEMAPDDSEWGGDAPARGLDDDVADATELARSQESLTAFLHRQALALRLNPLEAQVLHFLIESLNDDGYLEDALEDLARGLVIGRTPGAGEQALSEAQLEQLEALIEHFEMALRLLQSLEPVGVGARNLSECLALQIKAMQAQQLPVSDASQAPLHAPELLSMALALVQQPMELLARRDIKKLVLATGRSETLVRDALVLIARLEPKPGRRFVDISRQVVVPDVLVRAVGSGAGTRFRVSLNTDVMPKLRVHDIYANALKGHKAGSNEAAGVAALQQRLQEARWFIKNIQQRFDTILRVSEAIVERQKNFFIHGELAMRPLVLREIADALGLHESTISRVTTAKYMATPYGTFELKYFFGSGLGTDSGASASSTAVRALIKQFIAAENPKKPLSDNQIADMLKEQGIDCARRTVAKYREALKIAPANLRKTL